MYLSACHRFLLFVYFWPGQTCIERSADNSQSLTAYFEISFLTRSTGFILEGFPRTEAEARYLSTSGLFPDLAVILVVEDTEIADRLLPPMLEKWRKKRDKREAEKERQRALAKKQKVREKL